MKDKETSRAWLYARIPGNDTRTLECLRDCAARAGADGCEIIGSSTDEVRGWLLRPGCREMQQKIKDGKVDVIYVSRIRQISGKERHLFAFFKLAMQHNVKICTLEYNLRDRLHEYRLGSRIETYAGQHNLPMPL